MIGALLLQHLFTGFLTPPDFLKSRPPPEISIRGILGGVEIAILAVLVLPGSSGSFRSFRDPPLKSRFRRFWGGSASPKKVWGGQFIGKGRCKTSMFWLTPKSWVFRQCVSRASASVKSDALKRIFPLLTCCRVQHSTRRPPRSRRRVTRDTIHQTTRASPGY